MRFHPDRYASIDQVPGPIIAIPAARAASRAWTHGSPGCATARQASVAARTMPASDVRKPVTRSKPAMIASTQTMLNRSVGALCSASIPRYSKTMPTLRRMNSSPAPGQPSAKVKSNRPKIHGRIHRPKTSLENRCPRINPRSRDELTLSGMDPRQITPWGCGLDIALDLYLVVNCVIARLWREFP